jgi:protein-S-isoprenylcysteine O-methyltransferase Ste14
MARTKRRPNRTGAAVVARLPTKRRTEPVEVRPETVRGSGKKAARRDLESGYPLGDRSAYQDGLIADHGEAASNELEHATAERGEFEEELADVECEHVWREADVENGNAKIEKAERRRDQLVEAARPIGQMPLVAYVALMVLFSVAEYPLLKLSFTRLPADDRTIRLISVLVGMMLIGSVHALGLVASRVVREESDRRESRRDWQIHRAVLTLGVVFLTGAVVWLAMLRASEISAVSRQFAGQGVSHPSWLGAALGLLHALVLLSAFYLAYQRGRGDELRDIEAEIADFVTERATAEIALEKLERRRVRLLIRIDTLDERTELRLERLFRHHRHEEADYLAILRRRLPDPPHAIADWAAGGAIGRIPRSFRVRPAFTNGRLSLNGKSPPVEPWTTAARRIKPALRDSDRKENTP